MTCGAQGSNEPAPEALVMRDYLMGLGVPGEIAAQDACRMEHTISDETFEALKRHAEEYQ